MSCRTLILGGAGFVGSTIAERLVAAGDKVTVIDGFLDRSGGSVRNLAAFLPHVEFIQKRIEEVDNLPQLLQAQDVVIDAMAWTSHVLALHDPIYDLHLNVHSHLHLLHATPPATRALFVYLGSRGQFGNQPTALLGESAPQWPDDIQGIHKTAAESYFRLYARLKGLRAISLRFANCFGPNQPWRGQDVGLVGGFIRDLLAGKRVSVFGTKRSRNLLFARDLAEVVLRLRTASISGFVPLNVRGERIAIADLATLLRDLVGTGEVVRGELPDEIAAIDSGNAELDDEGLRALIGTPSSTPLPQALTTTINYFRECMK